MGAIAKWSRVFVQIDEGHLALRTGCELVNVSRSRFAISQSNLGSDCPLETSISRELRLWPQLRKDATPRSPFLIRVPRHRVRRLNSRKRELVSMGEGSPTVVLESALGGSSLSWALVRS